MSKVVEFNPTKKGRADGGELVKRSLDILESDSSPYVFVEKPVAKSSTNVVAGATVCRTCGCPKGAGSVQQRAEREITARANCNCLCHGRNR
jgi:hypothetical protein